MTTKHVLPKLSLTLPLLLLLLSGCASPSKPPALPLQSDCPVIPSLPSYARQTQRSESFSAVAQADMSQWLEKLTKPTAQE